MHEEFAAIGIQIPWWVKWFVLPLISLLPLPPGLKAIIALIVKFIESLPRDERRKARREVTEAAKHANQTGDVAPLYEVAKKYCGTGVGCASGLVKD